MREKEKSKFNPFAGTLRPTEEVLWITPQSEDSLWSQMRGPFRLLLTILGIVVVLGILKDIRNIVSTLALGAIIIGLFTVPILLWSAFERYVNPPRPQRLYAVTNERLLHYRLREVMSIPLEAIPSVSLFRGEGTKGTLNFGVSFPMWPDVEDAEDVKDIIDDARDERIEELQTQS